MALKMTSCFPMTFRAPEASVPETSTNRNKEVTYDPTQRTGSLLGQPISLSGMGLNKGLFFFCLWQFSGSSQCIALSFSLLQLDFPVSNANKLPFDHYLSTPPLLINVCWNLRNEVGRRFLQQIERRKSLNRARKWMNGCWLELRKVKRGWALCSGSGKGTRQKVLCIWTWGFPLIDLEVSAFCYYVLHFIDFQDHTQFYSRYS